MIPDSLRRTLSDQMDLVTRRQALDAGMTESAIGWAVSRTWHVVLPGVLHVNRARLTPDQRCLAALLLGGPEAALTGMTAASRYGISHADDRGTVRVAVPRRCSSRSVRWVQLRRTWVPYPVRSRGGLVLVEPARAVVEAARSAIGREQAEAIAIEAVQRRLVTLDDLCTVNEQLGRPGSALANQAIAAAADGAWSMPEFHLSRLVARSRVLPEMWCNPSLRGEDGRRLVTPDGWFDDVGVAVMVHSHRHHAGADWASTVEKDGELAAYGVRVVPIAPVSISREPLRVLERIEEVYVHARAAGVRPPVLARRRTDR